MKSDYTVQLLALDYVAQQVNPNLVDCQMPDIQNQLFDGMPTLPTHPACIEVWKWTIVVSILC